MSTHSSYLTYTQLSDTLGPGGLVRKELEPSEIIFVEEIATRYAAGDSLEKIHQDLGWPFARVKQLSSTEEFESFLFFVMALL